MSRAERVIFGVLALLLAAWLTIVCTDWLPRLSARQTQDLALLQSASPEPEGRNGFASLWTLGYQVPEANRAEILAADRQIHGDRLNWQERPDPLTRAADYPASTEVWPSKFCCGKEPMTLERIEARRWRLAPFIAGHAQLLDALTALEGYDVFHNSLPNRIWSAFPALQLLRFRPMQLALLHADQPDEAIAGLCSHIGMLRRLRWSSNSLLHEQLGTAFATDALALLADLQATHAAPLPASCDAILQPLADSELDTCNAMREQFAMSVNQLDELIAHPVQSERVTPVLDALMPLLINRRHTLAGSASPYARFCRDGRNLRDPDLGLGNHDSCSLWERALNPVGCTFVNLDIDFNTYQRRRLDLDRALQLLRIAQELHSLPAPLQPDLAALKSASGLAPGTVELDRAAGVLRLHRLYTKFSQTWEIPLPGSQRH